MELDLGLAQDGLETADDKGQAGTERPGRELVIQTSPQRCQRCLYLAPPQRTQLSSTIKIAWHHLAIEKLGDNP